MLVLLAYLGRLKTYRLPSQILHTRVPIPLQLPSWIIGLDWTGLDWIYLAVVGQFIGDGQRLCVFGGLCVDMWRLIHQWFWLFLTIGTLYQSSKTVKRQSEQQELPFVTSYTESAEYTKPGQLTRSPSSSSLLLYAGYLGLGPRLVGRIGSGVRLSTSFRKHSDYAPENSIS